MNETGSTFILHLCSWNRKSRHLTPHLIFRLHCVDINTSVCVSIRQSVILRIPLSVTADNLWRSWLQIAAVIVRLHHLGDALPFQLWRHVSPGSGDGKSDETDTPAQLPAARRWREGVSGRTHAHLMMLWLCAVDRVHLWEGRGGLSLKSRLSPLLVHLFLVFFSVFGHFCVQKPPVISHQCSVWLHLFVSVCQEGGLNSLQMEESNL